MINLSKKTPDLGVFCVNYFRIGFLLFLKVPEDALDLAEDFHILDDDRAHAGVFRLQPDVIVFLIEGLDGRLTLKSVHHSDDHVAVAGRVALLDQNVVSIHDAGFDHTLTADGQHEAGAADESGRDREGIFDVLLRQNRRACRDPADQRNVHDICAFHIAACAGCLCARASRTKPSA